ncbi:hypothetical protein [Pseudonocardia sp. ICBG1034]|uniref:hypothetical protein n=1 Tax=Pseudonocardia sp. ICBG1034 TaxID=2844381 RepID=UPI001CCFC26F|nr:hypothetical protein [Pseudonocardia sp. ICBG1034]
MQLGEEPAMEAGGDEVRETSVVEGGEHRDRALDAGRSEDDLAATVARAQAALAEIAAREVEDARAEQDPDHAQRREQLAQWAAADEVERAAIDGRACGDEPFIA